MSENNNIEDDGNVVTPEITETFDVDIVAETPGPVVKEPQSHTVHVNFKTNSDNIKFILTATQEPNIIVAANKKLRLISGRIYHIPVDTDCDSDNFGNLKIYSNMSEKIDIRYVKNGFASIVPLQHNVQLDDKTQLCVIW